VRAPHHAPGDTVDSNDADNTAAVILPENGAAVKFVPDGDVGTSGQNGPTVVPVSSADAIISSPKTDKDKDEKDKKEKPKLVGWFELVRPIFLHLLKKNL